MHTIANEAADAEFAHFPGRISDHPMVIIEQYAKTTIRQDLFDHAFDADSFFFGQGRTFQGQYMWLR